MANRSRFLWIISGAVAGVAGTLLMTGHPAPPVQAQPPAAAQPAKPADGGRYQISAWGVGQMTPAGKMQVANGAYIIDTQTGEVFSVANEGKPKPVGSVAEKK
jgi:hypothetical protein